ncbi:hypothetical protein N0V90_000823 [Kalmusia sp. IMI 367209]|nr:hypothetical protein N0V90_000823 [Kalmusia sp. IMI 367209]
MTFQTPDHAIDGVTPFPYNETNEYSKFSFECGVYRRTKREMLANGWDEAQIFGRNEVDVDTLLLGFVDSQESQPVPTWAAKMINKMLPTGPLPIRLASAFLLTKMMRLRQYLYQHPEEFVLGAFLGLIGINWPYTDDACHYWDIDSACTRLTPLFETHISDLDSWTLDAKALEYMPQIEGLVPGLR